MVSSVSFQDSEGGVGRLLEETLSAESEGSTKGTLPKTLRSTKKNSVCRDQRQRKRERERETCLSSAAAPATTPATAAYFATTLQCKAIKPHGRANRRLIVNTVVVHLVCRTKMSYSILRTPNITTNVSNGGHRSHSSTAASGITEL